MIHWDAVGVLATIAVPVIASAVASMRASNRLSSVLRDFPPHRHVGADIIYPAGFEPTEAQRMAFAAGVAAGKANGYAQ